MNSSSKEKMYMNPTTGSVDTADGWRYLDEDTGQVVDPVALGQVVEVTSVVKDGVTEWVEV